MDTWNNILHSQKGPWPYLRHWLILTILAEMVMFIFNYYLMFIYVIIALLFACGFLLRIFHLYPGQAEPLGLDLSAVFIALGYGLAAQALGMSSWRFLLILTSSTIILPHIFYIFNTFKTE